MGKFDREKGGRDKEMKKKSIKSNLSKKGKRKSTSDIELWKRRFNEIRMVAMRMPISEIARLNNISRETVYQDIEAYQELMEVWEKQKINREILTYEEVIRLALTDFSKTDNSNGKAALLGKAIEATKEITILKGARKVEGTGEIKLGFALEELQGRYKNANSKKEDTDEGRNK